MGGIVDSEVAREPTYDADREAPCLFTVGVSVVRPGSRAAGSVAKGDEIMDHSVQMTTTLFDKCTLRAWDDMRSQVWHELQDGADMPDEAVDFMGELVVMLKAWRSMKGALVAPNAS
jgi:hypothetical protein